MMRSSLVLMLIVLCIILTGCRSDATAQDTTRKPDVEPVATYDWMAGESPVANKRMGVERYGLGLVYNAVSPEGVYFMQESFNSKDAYICYVDHGSNTMVKLCGRPDCSHNTSDCNAYVYEGSYLSYYGGYLYAISDSNSQSEEQCKLIRMDPDGSNRVTVLDMSEFAKEKGGDFASCELITEGVVLFYTGAYETQFGGGTVSVRPKVMDYYLYRLYDPTEGPVLQKTRGVMHNCGDVVLSISAETKNGGEYALYKVDLETDTATYLTDHPGVAGFYGEKEGYYFRNGAICRFTYATQKEEIMVQTDLEGDYGLNAFPDCLVVSHTGFEPGDKTYYFYNWAFELVDTVTVPYSPSVGLDMLLVAETSERFFLGDSYLGMPKYYINKAELGTGNAEVHKFQFS